MKKAFVLIGIFVMFVFNCFVSSAYTQKRNIYALNETSWELSKIQQKDKVLSIPKGTNITINFSKDRINGHSAVNTYFGNYKIQNNILILSNVGTTEMAGSQELMDIERKFFDILQSSPKISYDKETLTLSNNKGEAWTFKALTLEKKLRNTNWQLINMAGKDMKFQLKNEKSITLSFTENEINGNAGINNYSGNYKIINDNISIEGIGATEMAGSDNLMKIEREYLTLLESVKKIKLVNQKTLVLTTDKGKILTFSNAGNAETVKQYPVINDIRKPVASQEFRCNNKKRFTVYYVTDNTIQLVDKNSNASFLLDQVVSASGSRYKDENIEIHIKGKEAIFTQNGKDISCRAVK